MMFFKNEGIVINKYDIDESDQFITIFTEDFGRVNSYIKGIKKSKKRDQSAVDTISLSEFSFYKKGEKFIVSNFKSIDAYVEIKSDIDKIGLALYLISILNNILMEEVRNIKLYKLTINTLSYMKTSVDKRKNLILGLYYLFKIIENEGILYNFGEGDYFSIDNSSLSKTPTDYSFKISEKEKYVLQALINYRIKLILEDIEYSDKLIFKVIVLLEKYMNFHNNINLNIKDFLMGEEILW